MASWPLGRLPPQLGWMGPALLVPSDALGSSPHLPLVTAGRCSKTPLFAGFSVILASPPLSFRAGSLVNLLAALPRAQFAPT
jgi:hypothetical protein